MARRRFQFDPERSRVWIEGTSSVHPIRASANGLRGWVEVDLVRGKLASEPALNGEILIEVDRLRSGNALIDRETRRRVDAKRHPNIVGRATACTRINPTAVELEGEIDFRGETHSVAGTLTVDVNGDEVAVGGSQTFDVRRWGLQPPKIGFLQVHPEVEVRFEAVGIVQPD